MATREITKRALAEAFASLVVEKGYESVTIGDIAERAGISRNTFYYHFSDKNMLVTWIFMRNIELLTKEKGLSYERLKAIGEYIYVQKDYYYKIMLSSASVDMFNRFAESEQKALSEKIVSIVGPDLFTESELAMLSRVYVNGIIGNIMDWCRNKFEYDPAPYVKLLADFIYNEVRAQAFEKNGAHIAAFERELYGMEG